MAEFIAQRALDAVARHCAAIDLARHGKAQARGRAITQDVQGQQRRRRAAAVLENPDEFRTHAYTRLAGQAEVHAKRKVGGQRKRPPGCVRP
jgi:hypothetical protein